jgi:arylsulfatase A-like enzyme
MDTCSDEDLKKAISHYMGQITYVDDNVGRILKVLKDTGNDKDTVLLFLSDHGELLGDYGMTHKNPTFYDCLSRIPAILVHPDGRWSEKKFHGLTEEVDLVPTILEMLGIEIPPTMVGKSWYNQINQNNFEGKENIICEAGGGSPTYREPIAGYKINAPHVPTSLGVGAMIREGMYKLSIYGDDRNELYDMENDPDELENQYDNQEYKEIKNHLTLKLLERTMSVKVRNIGLEWKYKDYPQDVRFEPLEDIGTITKDVRASGDYVMGEE